jgi:flagellar protein FlgJ
VRSPQEPGFSGTGKPSGSSGDVRKAAADFEALLIGQMLKSIRESSEGMGSGADAGASSSCIQEYAEQQVASVLAHSGGFGLSNLVASGLLQTAAPNTEDLSPSR